jgi:hypothetical protein
VAIFSDIHQSHSKIVVFKAHPPLALRASTICLQGTEWRDSPSKGITFPGIDAPRNFGLGDVMYPTVLRFTATIISNELECGHFWKQGLDGVVLEDTLIEKCYSNVRHAFKVS